MRPRPLALTAAAALAAVLAAAAPATTPALTAPKKPAFPAIVSASPTPEANDTSSGGFRRVTFSPDGDGRDDAVSIRVRAIPGHRLQLWLHPLYKDTTLLRAGRARHGVTTIRWNGRRDDGSRWPDGTYTLRVCDAATTLCSKARVLAHLRLLTMYAREDTGVAVGQELRVHISTDKTPPYTLDMVSVANPGAAGTGAVEVRHRGWTAYTVPNLPAGGLWLLRVRGGGVTNNFPLVVHEPTLALASPPAHTALVVYPWLTWRAYDMYDRNRDGHVDSWYAHPRTPQVPLFGPFEPPTDNPNLAGREPNPQSQSAFASWLQAHGLVAEHVTDVELGSLSPAVLSRYAAIVFEGHNEYYETSTYQRVLDYRDAGGRLYFMQGNPFYGAVRVGTTSVVRTSYRYRTAERSDFKIAAAGFRSCCWPETMTPPPYHVTAAALDALPWLFDGTHLRPGDPFGVAYGEVDTIDPILSPPGTIAVASATIPKFTPTKEKESYAWLGTNPIPYEPAWKRPRAVQIAYARTGTGEVFTWANTGFMRSIRYGDAGLSISERAMLDRVALNVWERFTR